MLSIQKKIVGLDLLRFSMAILMVLYHVQGTLGESIFKNLSLNGFYGTSVFFILSGFILAHVYSSTIATDKFSNTNFLIKRFNALYPIHIFTLIFSLTSFILINVITNKGFPIDMGYQTVPTITNTDNFKLYLNDISQYILKNVLLLQAWESRFLFLNLAAWSVSALFFFYLTFHYFTSWILKQKKLVLILILLWLSAMLFPLYLIISNNFSSENLGILHRNPLIRLPDFLAGITFYFICLKYPYNSKLKLPCLFFALFGFFAIYYFVKVSPYIGYSLSHNGLFLFSQLALIYFFIDLKIENIKLLTLIERLGKASLTIYMLHIPLLFVYFIAYKLVIASFNSSSLSDLMTNAKNIDHMNSYGLLFFLIILIPLSIIMQEKIFTPLQSKLNKKLLNRNKIKKTIDL